MRLDRYLVLQGMVETRSQATDLIRRGLVFVEGEQAAKTGMAITGQKVEIRHERRFVGRGGEKLMNALLDFNLDLNGKIVIDIGSSTGGFTDCALQHGASRVHAYDVGKAQMAESLRQDSRIDLHESTNIFDVRLPDADVILIDVSFVSVIKVLGHVKDHPGEVIALVKPQFEAGPGRRKDGVVKDLRQHKLILRQVLTGAQSSGYVIQGLAKAKPKGSSGNQEYMVHLNKKTNVKTLETWVGDV